MAASSKKLVNFDRRCWWWAPPRRIGCGTLLLAL